MNILDSTVPILPKRLKKHHTKNTRAFFMPDLSLTPTQAVVEGFCADMFYGPESPAAIAAQCVNDELASDALVHSLPASTEVCIRTDGDSKVDLGFVLAMGTCPALSATSKYRDVLLFDKDRLNDTLPTIVACLTRVATPGVSLTVGLLPGSTPPWCTWLAQQMISLVLHHMDLGTVHVFANSDQAVHSLCPPQDANLRVRQLVSQGYSMLNQCIPQVDSFVSMWGAEQVDADASLWPLYKEDAREQEAARESIASPKAVRKSCRRPRRTADAGLRYTMVKLVMAF